MISERHTTQQSCGFVWSERVAGPEYAEPREADSRLDQNHRYAQPMGYGYGQSKVRLRPVVQDENYWDEPKPKALVHRKNPRKTRKDKGVSRNPYKKKTRYRVTAPVIEPAVKAPPRYRISEPVVTMLRPPWWDQRERNAEVMDELEGLLNE